MEDIQEIVQRKKPRKFLRSSSEAVKIVTMNALKETMKMKKSPLLMNQTFHVKDNRHGILDFDIRNKLKTINPT